MNRIAKTFLTITLVLAAVLMAACPQSTTIRDIQNDPGRFRDVHFEPAEGETERGLPH